MKNFDAVKHLARCLTVTAEKNTPLQSGQVVNMPQMWESETNVLVYPDMAPDAVPVQTYAAAVDMGDGFTIFGTIPTTQAEYRRLPNRRCPPGAHVFSWMVRTSNRYGPFRFGVFARFSKERNVWTEWPERRGIDNEYGDVKACLFRLNVVQAILLQRRYEWCARIRTPGGVWAEMLSTPERVLQAFRLRDIPDGKRRRDALLHWVSEYRRNTSSGEKVDIPKHMRGVTRFAVDGWECVIRPPDFDVERLPKTAKTNSLRQLVEATQ